MPSKATYLDIINRTPFSFTITISEIDNSDWDGDSRPDHNFNNVTINSGQSNKQREEVNTSNASSWYRMTLHFSNGVQLTFRNDQRDAEGSYNRTYMTQGDYHVNQVCHNDTNTMTITYKAPGFDQIADWMKYIPDGVNMCALTIPGTHDSGTTNGTDPGLVGAIANFLVITQSMSITQQLNAGIRFFDIRCNNNGDNFHIQHGSWPIIGTTFESVLNDCKNFLVSHPKEIILMSVKEEGDAHNSKLGFSGAFKAKYTDGYPWFRGKDIPTKIDQWVRGRIVLINRFHDPTFEFGYFIDVKDNDYSNGTTSGIDYHIQDLYNVDSACNNKVNQITQWATQAAQSSGTSFYLNFASGSNGAEPLLAIAGNVNPRIEPTFHSAIAHFGTIAMDFPPDYLIKSLIYSNKFW